MCRSALLSFLMCTLGAAAARAQAPAPPPVPKIWTVAASAGLALTDGNTDTSTVNAAYDITYDPQRRNIVKSDALLIRGKTEGELSADRFGLNVRDEYKLTPKFFVFGQNQYLRDEFKDIDYLIAPAGGVGYKIFDTARTKFSVDGGLGSVWEKNAAGIVDTSAALVASERIAHALTTATTLTQTFSGLWKTEDLEDTLIIFGAGVAAAMSARTQLKFEFLDTFKNKPTDPKFEKNDIALLMAIVYKM